MADKEQLTLAAVELANLGWRLIPVTGKAPCGGKGWPDIVTSDPGEIAAMIDDTPCDGVGLVLGERSGVVDVECDGHEAEDELRALLGDQIPETPCYRSARGLHRLFAFDARLPAKAKAMAGKIEVRIGGGGRAAQSVLPPSGGREWIVHPRDCELAEIPEAIVAKLAERVAKPLPGPIEAPRVEHGDEQLDVGRWLARRGQEVLGFESSGGVRRWLIRCPRIDAHTTPNAARDCCVTQEEGSGRLGGHCFHASCGMGDWAALSEAIGRPEWQDYHPDAEPVDDGPARSLLAGMQQRLKIAAEPAAEPEDDEPEQDDYGEIVDPSFPSECLDVSGLLREITDYTLAKSRYPQPELALAGALALLGTITGRKVADVLDTRTNVYVLGLGLSGTGKEQARQSNKQLLIGALAEKMLGSERVGSHAGIVTTVHGQPAVLMQLDEMGRLLATMKDPGRSPHLYNCITVLMQLYSSSNSQWIADAYADAAKVKRVNQPHLCIYGTATPESFWGSLSTENVGEGLIGRLLVFEGRGYEVRMQAPAVVRPNDLTIEALRWWVQWSPGPGNLASENPTPHVVPHTPEAMDRFMGHVEAINERRIKEHPLRAAVWSRSGEKVAKLALLHACSRSRCLPETITTRDVDWAIRLGNWLTRRLLRGCAEHVSENEVEAKAKRVLGMITRDGVTARELSRRTQWLRSRERDEIVRDLIACGLVETETLTTGKRPKTVLKRRVKNGVKRASA